MVFSSLLGVTGVKSHWCSQTASKLFLMEAGADAERYFKPHLQKYVLCLGNSFIFAFETGCSFHLNGFFFYLRQRGCWFKLLLGYGAEYVGLYCKKSHPAWAVGELWLDMRPRDRGLTKNVLWRCIKGVGSRESWEIEWLEVWKKGVDLCKQVWRWGAVLWPEPTQAWSLGLGGTVVVGETPWLLLWCMNTDIFGRQDTINWINATDKESLGTEAPRGHCSGGGW